MPAQRTQRPTQPRMGKIVDAWYELGHRELAAIFPNLAVLANGWGEPCCFRCGWLVPVGFTWEDAGGWLEKAHLQDHRHGGSSEPLNFAPLCALCHEQQPECATREDGIAFVNSRSEYTPLLWVAQQVTHWRYAGVRRPGKDALRLLLRAYAQAGVLTTDAMRTLDSPSPRTGETE